VVIDPGTLVDLVGNAERLKRALPRPLHLEGCPPLRRVRLVGVVAANLTLLARARLCAG
jgi:hypothetical protein